MADYVSVFKPGDDLTMTAAATITGGQLVYVSAANSVTPTAGATEAWLGVATTDAATGNKVGVTSGGVQEVTASGTIAAGAPVISAAAGAVATIAAETNYARVVGIALTAATNGNKLRVRFIR